MRQNESPFASVALPASESDLLAAARAERGTDGIDLVATVSTTQPYSFGSGRHRVVAYDFGIKTTILRCLAEIATVEVVPASTSAADVLARRPDGVFLSNGPGDPAAVPYAVDAIQQLLGEVPVFGPRRTMVGTRRSRVPPIVLPGDLWRPRPPISRRSCS